VPQLQGDIRYPKRLGARLDYHATPFLLREKLLEPDGIHPFLFDDLSVAASYAYLRFLRSQIDGNMVHG
jgi:hypothetical protein